METSNRMRNELAGSWHVLTGKADQLAGDITDDPDRYFDGVVTALQGQLEQTIGDQQALESDAREEEQRHGDHQRQQRVDAEALVDVPRQVRREHQERGVRDHHDPHHAEVQREPGGEQRVEPAQQDAEDEALEEQGPTHCAVRSLASSLTRTPSGT